MIPDLACITSDPALLFKEIQIAGLVLDTGWAQLGGTLLGILL